MEGDKLGQIIKRMTPQFKLEEAIHLRIKLASFGVSEKKLARMTLRELLELEQSNEYRDGFTTDTHKLKKQLLEDI